VESPGGKMLVDVKKLTSGKYIKVETCTYIHTYVLLATTSIIIDTSINTDTAVLYSVHTYIGPKMPSGIDFMKQLRPKFTDKMYIWSKLSF
jgi:hypothetical protein